MKKNRFVFVLLTTLWLAGCGGSDAAGPDEFIWDTGTWDNGNWE